MVRVTVLYPNESAKRFDHDYYASKHLPMVMERLKGFFAALPDLPSTSA